MALYSRQQILVLVGLVAVVGSGLAIDRWRRLHPEAVENIERFDREKVREGEGGPPVAPARPAKLNAEGSAVADLVDLNRATAAELRRLPGIGPGLAGRIVEAREAAPFTSVDDLRRVRGLGAAKLERMRPLVTVGNP